MSDPVRKLTKEVQLQWIVNHTNEANELTFAKCIIELTEKIDRLEKHRHIDKLFVSSLPTYPEEDYTEVL